MSPIRSDIPPDVYTEIVRRNTYSEELSYQTNPFNYFDRGFVIFT